MALEDEPFACPPPLQSKRSARSLLSIGTYSLSVPFLGPDVTTAVTLASSDQAELTPFEEVPTTSVAPLTRTSRSSSPQPSDMVLPTYLGGEVSPFVGLLHDFVNQNINNGINTLEANKKIFNVLTGTEEPLVDAFLKQYVAIDKLGKTFSAKLKHFFILSSAGKPIYSMNGDDSLVLGYSGLITTIVASFEEGKGLEFRSISQKGFRMVVMNRSPLVLVAITKVSYELILGDRILERQLSIMYDYVLAVLSRPTITKSFHNRMNYDLRRILSAQDFRNLDDLATKLTFGFCGVDNNNDENPFFPDPSLYIGTLLDNSIQCAHASTSLRTKINDIFLASKRVRIAQQPPETIPFLQGKLYSADSSKYLAADLLFALLVYDNKLVSLMRPKAHSLSNTDITTLLSAVEQPNRPSGTTLEAEEPDLWVPICLPNFNESGFLHCYLRHFVLPRLETPLSLLLLSGSKNSFFEMRQSANYILEKIKKSKSLTTLLPRELALNSQLVARTLSVLSVHHFIYKRRKAKQFYMDAIKFTGSPEDKTIDSIHYLYLYTALFSSKAQEVKVGSNLKKLTYTRWHIRNGYTGFLLSDEKYEFYCLCVGFVPSLQLIEQSLRIINWCDRYRKRLFIDDGVQF